MKILKGNKSGVRHLQLRGRFRQVVWSVSKAHWFVQGNNIQELLRDGYNSAQEEQACPKTDWENEFRSEQTERRRKKLKKKYIRPKKPPKILHESESSDTLHIWRQTEQRSITGLCRANAWHSRMFVGLLLADS